MSKTPDQQVPEMFTIEQSSEKADKWFIQHKIPDKGYLLRSGQLSRELGPTGDFTNYHDSEEAATDFALAMERIPLREVCQKCGRPFATVHDFRAAQLFGLCPTRYAPRDPDAAKDCEKNVLKAADRIPANLAPITLDHLVAYVQAMIKENVKHRTKGYGLADMVWEDMDRHLREEREEARTATDHDSKCLEVADELGVLVHMICHLELAWPDWLALCLHKLVMRFEVPSVSDRPIVSVDMGNPGGDHTVHYQIDTETLEIEDVTEVVQAAEVECLKDELTNILFYSIKDLDVFTASTISMLARAYYNRKREKEAKRGEDSGTQPAV